MTSNPYIMEELLGEVDQLLILGRGLERVFDQ